MGIPFERAQQQAITTHLALQPPLRQRRTLIGRMRLLADQNDRLVMAELAQDSSDRAARVPRSDNHRAHGSPPIVRAGATALSKDRPANPDRFMRFTPCPG